MPNHENHRGEIFVQTVSLGRAAHERSKAMKWRQMVSIAQFTPELFGIVYPGCLRVIGEQEIVSRRGMR